MEEDNKFLKKSLEEFGDDLVKELIKELLKLDKSATGSLIRSIDYRIVEKADKVMLELLSNDYLTYVDKGRKPGKMPPISAILPWIKARRIKPRDKKTGRFITDKSGAFLIARSIGKKGIKPTNVVGKTLDKIYSKKKELLEKASIKDIEQMIDKIMILK